KVLPRPEEEHTLRLEIPQDKAIELMNRWAARPLPVSATCYIEGALHVRLSGSARTVAASLASVGGDSMDNSAEVWSGVREHRAPAFQGRLWRVSVRSTTPPLPLTGQQTAEWNGSLRWIATDAPDDEVHRVAHQAGGHATLFRGASGSAIMRLEAGVLKLNQRIKAALDPQGIFGPHRLHGEF